MLQELTSVPDAGIAIKLPETGRLQREHLLSFCYCLNICVMGILLI